MKKEFVALYVAAMLIASIIMFSAAVTIGNYNNALLAPPEKNFGPPLVISEAMNDYYLAINNGNYEEFEIKAIIYKIFNLCLQNNGFYINDNGKEISCEALLNDDVLFQRGVSNLLRSFMLDKGGVDYEELTKPNGNICSGSNHCQLTFYSPCTYKQFTSFFCEDNYVLVEHNFGGCSESIVWVQRIEGEVCSHFA